MGPDRKNGERKAYAERPEEQTGAEPAYWFPSGMRRGFPRKISLSFEGNSVFFFLPPANRCLSSAAPGTGRPAHVAGRFFCPGKAPFLQEETESTEEIAKDGLPAHRVERQRGFQPRFRGAQARLHPAERRQMTPPISRMGADYRSSGGEVSACAGRGGTRGSPLFSLNHRAFSAAPNYAFLPSETAFSPLFSLHNYFSPKSSCRARGDW